MKLYQKILAILCALFFILFTVMWFVEYVFANGLFLIVYLIWQLSAIVLLVTLKSKVLNRVILYSIPVLFIIYILLGLFVKSEDFAIYLFILSGIALIASIVTYYKRFDLIFSLLTSLILYGLMLKHWHMPGAGPTIMISALGLGIYSVASIVRAYRTIESRYLTTVIIACSIIIAGLSASLMLKVQHLPGGGILMIVFTPAYILATLIILLTLPGSNFTEWKVTQRRILTRGVLIPWIFYLYILVSTSLIPPYNMLKPFFFMEGELTEEVNFKMRDYEVEEKSD